MLTDYAVFDNWRILHGRAAFTGKRRMCGGYSRCYGGKTWMIAANKSLVNRDDFISKYRMTNLSEDEIRASTVTG